MYIPRITYQTVYNKYTGQYYNKKSEAPKFEYLETNSKSMKPKTENKKLLWSLSNKSMISGYVLLFASRKSPHRSEAKYLSKLMDMKIEVVNAPELLEPYIECYDHVVIVDLLETLTSLMSRASVIKEALVALRRDKSHPCVIVACRDKRSVNEMDDHEKADLEIIEGIDTDELFNIATFAGAKGVQIIDVLEEKGMSYVRIT
jgi:hypothetical protein